MSQIERVRNGEHVTLQSGKTLEMEAALFRGKAAAGMSRRNPKSPIIFASPPRSSQWDFEEIFLADRFENCRGLFTAGKSHTTGSIQQGSPAAKLDTNSPGKIFRIIRPAAARTLGNHHFFTPDDHMSVVR